MRSSILSFLVVVICLSAPIWLNAQSKKEIRNSNSLVEQGNKSFNQRNFRAAIDKYVEAIKVNSANSAAHFRKGYAHYSLNEYDQALLDFDKAFSLGHNPIEIYKVRWYVNKEKKNFDAALSDLKLALEADPKNVLLLRGAGDVYVDKSAYREALDAYQKAVVAAPNDGDLYYKISNVQFNLGDPSGQASAAEEAVRKHTQFLGHALFLMGDAYQKQGKSAEALAAYQKSIQAKPDTYDAYRNMAEIYRSQNKFNDAIDISRKALPITENDGIIYTDLSWYYSLADRHDEAIQAAKAGILLLPKEYMAYTNLCRAYNDVNKPELAVKECTKALDINEKDGETHFYLGRAYDLSGKPAEATKAYKEAVKGLIEYTKVNPTYSDGYYLLGNAYYADNQREKAIEAYQKCLELSPGFVKARYNIGFIRALQKNKIAAMEQYNSLVKLDPALAEKLKAEIDKL